MLDEIGLGGRRIQMINLSAAMGGQFAWSAAELTEEIRLMGPNPLRLDGRGNGASEMPHASQADALQMKEGADDG